jgi:hypothetical protein
MRVLHELTQGSEMRQVPALANQQSEMGASRLLRRLVKQPICCGIRNPILDIVEGARLETRASQDFGGVDSEFSQQPGDFGQTSDALTPRLRDCRRLAPCRLLSRDIAVIHVAKNGATAMSCQSGRAVSPPYYRQACSVRDHRLPNVHSKIEA